MTQQDPNTPRDDYPEDVQTVAPQQARGAKPGGRILVLLILSAGAAAVLLLGMWALSNGGFATQNPNAGQQAVDARAFSGNEAEVPNADAPTTSTGEPTNPATGEAPNKNAPTVQSQQ